MDMYHIYEINGPGDWIVYALSHTEAKREVVLYALGSPDNADEEKEYQEFVDGLGTRRYKGKILSLRPQINIQNHSNDSTLPATTG